MKALVFGGAGFLGSHVADELTKDGHDVTLFDCRESEHRTREQKMVLGDILDRDAVKKAVKGAELVLNFAGLADLNASLRKPMETLQLNVLGNANIVDACVAAGCVKRFIYASTVYVFSNKGSFYGVSKRCSEELIQEYGEEFGLEYTILRYGSVYGGRANEQNRIYRILREALLERKITFQGNGEEEREYIHVRDAAALTVECLAPQFKNQHIILTGVERFRYSQLLQMVNEMLGGTLKIKYLGQSYKGHYTITPYSFHPMTGRKILRNPFIDFGQGLLETIAEIHAELRQRHPEMKEIRLKAPKAA